MVGHRPVPTEAPHDYSNVVHPDQMEGPAYLYIALPQFIEEMRKQYGEEWEDFMDAKPGLYRALVSREDLEW